MHSWSKKQKIVLIVGIVLVVFLIVVAAFLIFTQKERRKEKKRVSTAKEITRDYVKNEPYIVLNQEMKQEIAQEIITYIQSQKREDGYYEYFAHYDELCGAGREAEICPILGERMYPTANAWTALAYLGAYVTNKDRNYLSTAIKDILILRDWCFSKPRSCSWVLVQPAKVYLESGDPEILAFLRKEGEILLQNTDTSAEGFMLRAIEVRELILLYKITSDERYLEEAKERYDRLRLESLTQKKLYENPIASYPVEGCWFPLASIEMAKTLDSSLYQQDAVSFLDKARISDFFTLFPHPVEIQPCIESYFELSNITGEDRYYVLGSDYMSRFIATFWDGEQNPKIYGEGGTIFTSRSDAFKIEMDNDIIMTDSAYTLYLISLASSR